MPAPVNQPILADSPFNLASRSAYLQWRKQKFAHQVSDKAPGLADLLVTIDDPTQLTQTERLALIERCDRFNIAIYQLNDTQLQDKTLVHALGEQLGLLNLDTNLRADEDSVSSLQVRDQAGNQYVPYTNKALSWHTDGYYNRLEKQIYGIIMHCVRPASEGGVNALMNPESVYIALRDENPAYIAALMHPEAMTIPDNVEAGSVIRAAQTGPVFMLQGDGRLHMRYSARKRNIVWRDTEDTRLAVAMLNRLMADENYVTTVALKAGQGLVCNNVLHNRSSFIDSDKQKRLMYRARYYDAVHQVKNEK